MHSAFITLIHFVVWHTNSREPGKIWVHEHTHFCTCAHSTHCPGKVDAFPLRYGLNCPRHTGLFRIQTQFPLIPLNKNYTSRSLMAIWVANSSLVREAALSRRQRMFAFLKNMLCGGGPWNNGCYVCKSIYFCMHHLVWPPSPASGGYSTARTKQVLRWQEWKIAWNAPLSVSGGCDSH